MSTKNLARTVIEGGRYSGNKTDRYLSNAEERARVRNYIQEVTLDPENYEEYDVEPREHVWKGFKDKLGPMYRWLQSQVGRPWNEVRSEVAQKFDTRTTAGRHIVHDHLLQSVQTGPEAGYGRYSVPGDETSSYSDHEYYVDAEGILCKKRYLGRRRYPGYERLPDYDTNRLANWLNGRCVGRVGDKFFWFVPVGKAKKHRGMSRDYNWRTQWGPPKQRMYYYGSYGLRWEYEIEETVYKMDSVGQYIYQDELDENGRRKLIVIGRQKVWKNGSKPSLRQDRKLNEDEMRYWDQLPVYYQTKILEESPNYPKPPKKDLYSGYYY
jgi:hypothetical protein